MLALMPELDVRVVHLVRDARAVAHSWRRLKPAPDRLDHPYMRQLTPARVALLWATSNLGAELFCRRAPGRYLRVRYEDFIARPRDCIDRISRMTTGKPAALPWVGEHALEIRATHSVSGNPARLATGRVELTLDAEWKTAMPPTDRRLTTALTWPLLLRYGYLRGS